VEEAASETKVFVEKNKKGEGKAILRGVPPTSRTGKKVLLSEEKYTQ